MRSFLLLTFLYLPFVLLAQALQQTPKNIEASSTYNLIPKPVSLTMGMGKPVIINNRTVIYADSVFFAQAYYLQNELKSQCGLLLPVATALPTATTPALILKVDSNSVRKPEMYILSVKDKQVVLNSKDVRGTVNGIQSLLQMFPLQKVKQWALKPVIIEDYPRFAYRGMHLDVSRHFFSVDFVKKYIDYLTFHKFNTFHWHLTDDQGWRIEIKSYPRLTEVGAWRDSTLIGHFRDLPHTFDGKRHGGFYTQEQVKDIINYATVRGVTIIPEIDIPGHSRAAIASYPEFSTNPDSNWRVATKWGMYNRENNVLAPTPATFEFLKKTFDEIADLFPSQYIHIGGDECSKMWWKADPKSQGFIKQHELKDEAGLQTYIIQQVIDNLKLKGKKVIGWEEILEGELDTSAIIMNWKGVAAAVKAAERKHNVIITPGKPLYFDYYQTKDKDSLAIAGYTPLEEVYAFEVIPKELSDKGLEKYIVGAQANVWTEYMEFPSKVEYQIFPRMTALSEVLWTETGTKNYSDFVRRLKANLIPRYEYWGASYFREFEKWDLSKK